MQLTGRTEASVRPAAPPDAPELARVQRVTWRTAYRSLLPLEVLDGWDDEAVAASWAQAISSPPTPGHAVLVAREGTEVAGFAACGPAELGAGEQPSPDGPTTEISTLLVEPRWGRRGHGSRLLAAVVDRSRETGTRRLQMWVPEPDDVTATFLESAGWAADGWTRVLDTGSTTIRQDRWHVLIDEIDAGAGADTGAAR